MENIIAPGITYYVEYEDSDRIYVSESHTFQYFQAKAVIVYDGNSYLWLRRLGKLTLPWQPLTEAEKEEFAMKLLRNVHYFNQRV